MSCHCTEAISKIENRIDILIIQNSPLSWKIRQKRPSILFQQPVVDLIQVCRYVHFLELFSNHFQFFFRQISFIQCLVFVDKIIQQCFYSGQKRHILEFKIEHLQQFFCRLLITFILHTMEINQPVFQFYQESLYCTHIFLRLLPLISLLILYTLPV